MLKNVALKLTFAFLIVLQSSNGLSFQDEYARVLSNEEEEESKNND